MSVLPPSFMAEYGDRLVDNGYPVIPIMPGSKAPGRFTGGEWRPYSEWTRHCDRPTKGFETDIWRRWPGCGVGIACGAVVGVDIDILDASLAIMLGDVAAQMLGPTPCLRIGRAPKRLLVYRTDIAFAGRKRHPLETLARGQQFVAFAMHPDTGRPYEWPEASLLDTPIDNLPMVTEGQCLAFLDAAWQLLPDSLRQKSLLEHAPVSAWRGPSDPKGTLDAITSALEMLTNDDLIWDDWFRIGFALKAAIGERGRDLWLSWSAQSRKDVPTWTAKFWAQARPHSIGAGTIYWYAEQRGWKPPSHLILNGNAAEEADGEHRAAGMLARLPKPAEPAPAYRVPAALTPPPGALADFVHYATTTAISPQPFLALGAAICMVGAVAGRRYRTRSDLRTNFYAIGIADSGGGKDHARKCAKRSLYAAGLDRYLGGEELASSAGLITSLQRHPARLFQIDEFGKFLRDVLGKTAPAHKSSIWSEMTKLFTSASEAYIGAEYADQKARPRVTIEQPCACVYGVSVPGTFWPTIEGGTLADGSVARFLVFLTEDDYPDRNKHAVFGNPPEQLVETLKAIAAGVPDHDHGGNLAVAMEATATINPYTVPETAAAAQALDDLRDEAHELLRTHRGTWATALFGRYAENAAKLALLAAVAGSPANPVIGIDHVAWGRAMAEHCIRTLMREADRLVSDSPVEARLKRILDIIRKAGRINGNDFARKTQWASKRERDEAIDVLIESGQVVRTVVVSGARPAVWLAVASAEPVEEEPINAEQEPANVE